MPHGPVDLGAELNRLCSLSGIKWSRYPTGTLACWVADMDLPPAPPIYAVGLEEMNEDLGVLSENETDFLPITTKAYLYLSGTPFKALATGQSIEEQIFNWTYTDEQRAKEEFATKHPAD